MRKVVMLQFIDWLAAFDPKPRQIPMADGAVPPFPKNAGAVELHYEQRLNEDPRWALSEGSRHFDEKSAVHAALRKICSQLNDLGIPYAVAGGMALFLHGFRRFTEDVYILVTNEDLKRIHQHLSGRGYLPLFERSKNLRDTEQKVRIEFLVAGHYPGDGKEKPVAFPNPADVAQPEGDIQIVNLPTLVELKLASGMSGTDRMKDLADVQELIKLLSLPWDFGDQLNPYVQEKYRELWKATLETGRRYLRIWRNKWLTAEARSITEMISQLREAAEYLDAMRADGVTLDPEGGTSDDYAYLITTDPDVAKKYDMHEESEFLGDEDLESESEE
jgi:hypothetical protein